MHTQTGQPPLLKQILVLEPCDQKIEFILGVSENQP